jgi:hypothetical protein
MKSLILICCLLSLASLPIRAAQSAVACDVQLTVNCTQAAAHSAEFDAQGKLWVAFEFDGRIYVSYSHDRGQNFSTPSAVNKIPESIYNDGENRPKIALAPDSRVYVSWTRRLAQRFSGDIRFAYSHDGSATFSEPVTINDDGLLTSHRFDALGVNRIGEVFIAWLDKRDKVAARERGEVYTGAALYYAVSTDGGLSFSANQKLIDHSCECCRLALAPYDKRHVALMWRQIFPLQTRDHALALLDANGAKRTGRVSWDEWQIEACPHHGPDIAVAPETESIHAAWFSNGRRNQGLLYRRVLIETVGSEAFGTRVMAEHPAAAHPQIVAAGRSVVYAWTRFDGEETLLELRRSEDGGESWGDPEVALRTSGASGYAQLLKHRDALYLAWFTAREGYRIVLLN